MILEPVIQLLKIIWETLFSIEFMGISIGSICIALFIISILIKLFVKHVLENSGEE